MIIFNEIIHLFLNEKTKFTHLTPYKKNYEKTIIFLVFILKSKLNKDILFLIFEELQDYSEEIQDM
ncbi:hypothetical protein C1646_707818 [Rhizophagus diaphanus]|nr:hypothetical protein C1646_707818 [Rhizophagus diaphanus] [Rhizophagus sp. MUCL 43196]